MDIRRSFSAIFIVIAAGCAILSSRACSFADASADQEAIKSEIATEEAAESNLNAAGTIQYDAPDFKEWDYHGKLGITGKDGDLKQVEANFAACKSVNLHEVITSAKFSGATATLTVLRVGTIVLASNGHTEPISYKATQKQIWVKSGSEGWLEKEAHGLTMALHVIK